MRPGTAVRLALVGIVLLAPLLLIAAFSLRGRSAEVNLPPETAQNGLPAPSGVHLVTKTQSSATIAWSPVRGARYTTSKDGEVNGRTSALSHTFTGLECGTTYRLGVEATSAAGRSAGSPLDVRTRLCLRATAGVPIYTRQDPPATPVLDDLPRRSSLTKDGVTWTFSRPVPVGQFITGDYYAVGAVTVVAISPKPARGRNGSIKNLPANDEDTAFDRRTQGERFRPDLRANPPVTLSPGDSLVSSISVRKIGRPRWLFGWATASPVKTVSILTSVAAPQSLDAFRPSYAGHSPIYHTRNLRREILPRLSGVPDTPSLSEWQAHFRRPWVDNVFFNFDAPVAYMPDYAREIARAVGTAGLLLSLDFTPREKEPLLVYLTQYGIDLAGLVRAGHPGWWPHGGHGSGRKFPIIFAGVMLDDASMKQPRAVFGEDAQTITGTGWTGAHALFAGHYGVLGRGRYGPYEHLQPRDWPSLLGEDYRRCCTSSAWIGEALAARLISGMIAAWNHAPFFEYVDRWMNENDTRFRTVIKTQTGADYSGFPQRVAWDSFVTNMWHAYRNK